MTVHTLLPGIHAIRFPISGEVYGSAFLLTGERPALVDAGPGGNETAAFMDAMSDVGIAAGDLSLLVLSHAHWDHMNGAAELRAEWGVPTASLDSGVERFQAPSGLWTDFCNRLNPLGRGLTAAAEDISPTVCTIDQPLEAGQGLKLGNGYWQVLAAPGHCESLALFWNEAERCLIATDAIQIEGTRGGIPVIEDIDIYLRSIDLIEALDPATLVLSHPFLPFGKQVLVGEDAASAINLSRAAVRRLQKTFLQTREGSDGYGAFCAHFGIDAGELLSGLTWMALDTSRRNPATSQKEQTPWQQ